MRIKRKLERMLDWHFAIVHFAFEESPCEFAYNCVPISFALLVPLTLKNYAIIHWGPKPLNSDVAFVMVLEFAFAFTFNVLLEEPLANLFNKDQRIKFIDKVWKERDSGINHVLAEFELGIFIGLCVGLLILNMWLISHGLK